MVKSWIALFIVFAVYTTFVYSNCDKRSIAESKPDRQVLAGWKTWQAKNCQSCHQVYGLGGYMGPDLTNIAADPAKGDVYMRTFIKYGTGRMPNFNLADTDIDHLVAFLTWVNKSGKTKVPTDRVTWWGNYNLDN